MSDFPEWVGQKIGNPIFTDADFTNLNFKYGTSGLGPGTITRDTNHVFGGPGAVNLTTGALINHATALKRNIPYMFDGDIVTFELKFIPDPLHATNQFVIGFKLLIPAIGTIEGHVIFDETTNTIMYQDGATSYTAFDPVLNFPSPRADAAAGGNGDEYGWLWLSIDINKLEFVQIIAAGRRGRETRDMVGLPMINTGAAASNKFVVECIATNAVGGGATTAYTTDWAVAAL